MKHFKIQADEKPLSNLSILDVGCGGGIASIPISKLGAKVVGIDPSLRAINAAKNKAQELNLENVNFFHVDVEFFDRFGAENFESEQGLPLLNKQFDVVLCLDVVEHVENLTNLVACIAKWLKPGGAVIVSTINKTFYAFAQAIIAAEYLLRMLPVGTHEYHKFVKPSMLQKSFSKHSISIQKLKGFHLSILKNEWEFTDNIEVNYMALLS